MSKTKHVHQMGTWTDTGETRDRTIGKTRRAKGTKIKEKQQIRRCLNGCRHVDEQWVAV